MTHSRFKHLSDSQLKRIDQVCIEFEQALAGPGSGSAELEQRVMALPEELQATLFEELLAVELEHRFQLDERPSAREYELRFPAFAVRVQILFARLADVSDKNRFVESRIERLASVASRIPDGAARSRYLENACGGDPHLLTQIENLLPIHAPTEQLSAPHEGPPSLGDGTGVAQTETAAHDSQKQSRVTIGPYRLLEQIGQGGMGTVWKAAQQHPVQRVVALKIIKAGMDTHEVIARFEAERQALAIMDHPNIAKVLDAGATDEGRPYFVMELVKGVPITEFCDSHQLPFEQRIELFITVCDAVQHAHQKGIIHRDIKPSNVLVAEHNDKPVAQVIDFGLAKATGSKLTEKTVFTAIGQMVGTPAYMSPEQADMNATDVDTRTDIYSLGVLLYELLTGVTPLDTRELRKAGYAEIQRLIREREPPRMSKRITSLGEESSITAKKRRTDTKRMSKILSGDLDIIVMNALAKEPNRRYATPSNFAADLRRYLSNEPIEARPASSTYRLRKLVQRNKGVFVAGALVALSLIAGLLEASRQASIARANLVIAQEERQKAVELQQLADVSAAAAVEQKTKAEQSAIAALKAKEREMLERAKAEEALYFSRIALAENNWQAGNLSRSLSHLELCIPKDAEADLRGWEWHYLYRLCHPDLLTLPNLGSWMYSVAHSPHGNIIAGGGGVLGVQDDPDNASGFLRLWDARNGDTVVDLSDQVLGVRAIAFSPDGRKLLTGGGDLKNQLLPGQLKVWDVETQQTILELRGNSAVVYTVGFSPDGTLVASGSGIEDYGIDDHQGELLIFDAVSGQVKHRIQAHAYAVRSLAFDPNGKRIATLGGDDKLCVWDVESGAELFGIAAGRSLKMHVGFSPDGSLLVSSNSDGVVSIWDSHSGELQSEMRGHDGVVWDFAFSPDGRSLATAGADESLRIWNLKTAQETRRYRGHLRGVRSVAFSPDGSRLISCGQDETLRVWDATRDTRARQPFRDEIHGNNYISALAFSPDQQLHAALLGGRIQSWNPRNDVLTTEGLTTSSFVFRNFHDTQFSPDCSWLVGPSWWIRDADTWETVQGNPQHRFGNSENYLASSCISGDGKLVATVSRLERTRDTLCVIKLWNPADGRELLSMEAPAGYHRAIALNADGSEIALAAADSSIRVYDRELGHETFKLEGHQGIIMALAYSRDGSTLVSAGFEDQTIHVWDTALGTKLHVLQAPATLTHLVFSPDDRRLAAIGFEGITRLWSTESWLDVFSLPGLAPQRPGDFAYNARVAFSPDGYQIASTNWDGSINVWDATPPGKAGMDTTEHLQLNDTAAAFVWHFRQAQASYLASDGHAFRTHLSRLRSLQPPNSALQAQRGRLLALVGKYELALADAANSLPTSPHDIELWLLGIALHLRNDDTAGFERALVGVVRNFKTTQSPTHAVEVARILALRESVSTATQSEINKQLKDVGEDPWGLQRIETTGVAGNPNTVHILALTYFRAQRYAECIEWLNGSLEAHPNWPAAVWNWQLLAMAHHQLGQTADSIAWLEKADQWLDEVSPDRESDPVWLDDDALPIPPGALRSLPLEPAQWLIALELSRQAHALVNPQ